MTRSNRILLTAVAVSTALHLAALFGTPRFEFGRLEEDMHPAPLEATIMIARAEPPAKITAAPAQQPANKRPSRPTTGPAAAPLPVAATSVLEAPSPDGEPVADAQAFGAGESGDVAVAVDAGAPALAPEVAEERAVAEYPFRRVRLIYDLFYANSPRATGAPTKIGELVHTWAQDGERYEAESVAEAVGLVSLFYGGKFVQRSTGRITADGLQPAEYTLERGRGEPSETARFDWTDRKVALAWKNSSRTLVLPAGTQDPLSMVHQLYFLQPMPESGHVSVASSRKLYRSYVERVGEEVLDTPLGRLRTLHFRRQEADGAATGVWVDLDRDLLPVRVQAVDRSGNVLDQLVREVRLEPAAQARAAE